MPYDFYPGSSVFFDSISGILQYFEKNGFFDPSVIKYFFAERGKLSTSLFYLSNKNKVALLDTAKPKRLDGYI